MSETRAKREIKPVGKSESKLKALEQMKKLKEDGGKRTDQYQVVENDEVYEEIGDDADDFIVGDDGYKDYGDEEEDYEECDGGIRSAK